MLMSAQRPVAAENKLGLSFAGNLKPSREFLAERWLALHYSLIFRGTALAILEL
jgi:hypothetical protein